MCERVCSRTGSQDQSSGPWTRVASDRRPGDIVDPKPPLERGAAMPCLRRLPFVVLASYNFLSAAHIERRAHIHGVLRQRTQVVKLQGTRRYGAAEPVMYPAGGYHMFEMRKHRRGKKHAGVSLALSATMVAPMDIAQVEVGDGAVRGRATMVRVTQRTSLDVAFFSVYWPPASLSTTRSARR